MFCTFISGYRVPSSNSVNKCSSYKEMIANGTRFVDRGGEKRIESRTKLPSARKNQQLGSFKDEHIPRGEFHAVYKMHHKIRWRVLNMYPSSPAPVKFVRFTCDGWGKLETSLSARSFMASSCDVWKREMMATRKGGGDVVPMNSRLLATCLTHRQMCFLSRLLESKSKKDLIRQGWN